MDLSNVAIVVTDDSGGSSSSLVFTTTKTKSTFLKWWSTFLSHLCHYLLLKLLLPLHYIFELSNLILKISYPFILCFFLFNDLSFGVDRITPLKAETSSSRWSIVLCGSILVFSRGRLLSSFDICGWTYIAYTCSWLYVFDNILTGLTGGLDKLICSYLRYGCWVCLRACDIVSDKLSNFRGIIGHLIVAIDVAQEVLSKHLIGQKLPIVLLIFEFIFIFFISLFSFFLFRFF